MEYGFLSRAGKFLQEQKKHRRWMMIFLCLAGGVILGTLGYLKLYGQAMTHKMKVLECQYEVHEHTDECYEEAEDGTEVLVCGYADYVIHVHNDDCFNKKGELVCTLEEHELHEHSEDCYGEEQTLICTEPETDTPADQETSDEAPVTAEEGQDTEQPVQPESPVQTEESVQICELEEHTHGEGCYAESQSCGLNEHTHGDGCYTETQTCGLNEHTHGDGCYTETQTCGLGEHSHDDGCYDEEGGLVCGEEEHSHDGSCMSTEFTCTEEEHTHDDSCVSTELTCTEEEHTHTGACMSGELICGVEEHTHGDGCYEQQASEAASRSDETETEESEPAAEEPVSEEPASEESGEAEEGHTHTDECYETEEGLICGEQELHMHDDSCYTEDCFDEDGNLIEGSRVSCGLLQLEEHVHTEECFKVVELTPEEVAALNGGAVLHVHSEDCYDEEGKLICGHEVTHIHGLDCYDEEGHLICGFGEGTAHEHGTACYDEEGNLICGYEDAKDHEHDAGCYDEEGNLTCGFEDAKDHEHDAGCYDEEGNLICGYEGVKDHEHSEACYDEEGNLICGYEGVNVHEHDARCYDIYGELICGYEGAADHVHTEGCYDEEGNLVCGYELRAVYEQSKIFECADYVVVARYNNDAGIPEEAEFLAEQITQDMDEEHYVNREAEYKELMGDEDASMKALLKIGFYMEEDGEKKEIEPKTPVAIAVQFLDEDGLAEGSPITIIHFAEGGTEKLDGSDAKDNSTTFTMESFSEIAIGQSEKKMERQAGQPLQLSDDFEYEASPFLITFHVEGTPTDLEGNPVIVGAAVSEDGSEGTEGSEPEGDASEGTEGGEPAAEPDADLPEDGTAGGGNGNDAPAGGDTDIEGTDMSVGNGSGDNGENGEGTDKTGLTPDASEDGTGTDTGVIPQEPKLVFSVEAMDDDAEIKEALAKYLGESDGTVTQRVLHALSYTLSYGETELNLDNCTVTAEITFGTASSDDGADAPSEEGDDASAGDAADEGAADENTANTAGDAPAADEGMTTDPSADDDTVPDDMSADSGDGAADGQSDGGTEGDESDGREPEEGEAGENGAGEAVAAYMASTDLEASADVDVSVMLLEISRDKQTVKKLDIMDWEESEQLSPMSVTLQSNMIALADEVESDPVFTVQYYAYAQILEDAGTIGGNIDAIEIIDTSGEEKATLPRNGIFPKTRKMYVEKTGSVTYTGANPEIWGVYDPLYKDAEDSLTKIYTADRYRYNKAPGLEYVNKFAKAKLHYDLFEVWVLKKGGNADSEERDDWVIYGQEKLEGLKFTNNPNSPDLNNGNVILINSDTVLRLVGKSNEGDYNNDVNFFDYDFTDGGRTAPINIVKQGINSDANYSRGDTRAKLGFGNNSSGHTGLKDEKLGDYYINQAQASTTAKTIIEKCSYGLATSRLDENHFPVLNVNAPNLFDPNIGQIGKEVIPGFSLDFMRNGDTYTLTSVKGSSTDNLQQFQRGTTAWYPDGTVVNEGRNRIWTNQFWPMDSAKTFGTDKHDIKFGTADQALETKTWDNNPRTLAKSDDKKEHNSFFGMNFAVEFRLTDDYVGPLNYYFFGDDDMWVYLEHPDGSTELICDIGGVHQAAGEYVDLWNYIEKPQEGRKPVVGDESAERIGSDTTTERGDLYYLRFFYTERGASGSTCWMQFTLPSVNAVPVIHGTGDCKNTLTMKKTVDGAPTDEEFEFTIKFEDADGHVDNDTYAYQIVDKDNNPVIGGAGSISTGGTFHLRNEQSIIIRNLPDGARYSIEETKYDGYKPGIDEEHSTSGVILKDQTVEGSIDWKRDDEIDFINHSIPYELPETGGSGAIWYMMASAFLLSLGVGLIYSKKFSERRV